MKNIEKYKEDLDQLLRTGNQLMYAMRYESTKDRFVKSVKKQLGEKANDFLDSLPSFIDEYQPWYSEAMAIVRQLLPDRIDDFVSYYEKPKNRKEITYETYRISDYLLGLISRSGLGDIKTGRSAAIPRSLSSS